MEVGPATARTVVDVTDAGVTACTTVVLPTFRRPEGVRRVLRALARQADPGTPWEVVVVDNDEPPGAEPVFDEVVPTIAVPVRLVREPARGASNARNRGIREATGDVIAFVDDDVDPREDWLAEITRPIREGRCTGTGGRVILDPSVPRPTWFDERRLGGYLASYDRGSVEIALDVDDYVLTANAAFTTAALREVGGLDPLLGPRDGVPLVNDDVELCRRLLAAGHVLRFVPSAVVVHELPPARLRPKYIVRRLYSQGRSDWMLDRHRLHGLRLRGVGGLVPLMLPAALEAIWQLAYAGGFARQAVADLIRRTPPPPRQETR